MKTEFRRSFSRDVKKIKDRDVLDRVRAAVEVVEAAADLEEIAGLKKLSGSDDCFRIRVGDFRIGITLNDDTVVFVRCLNRRDLYRFFP